ncbi:hypothetical protein [Pseudovibrio ascidiaceicola]|uniref:hypothetical protein n=1 Tax=Pseudovibrio ascidiaceicola TaxID=285279 RepID=UPI000D695FD5|nr:hypothetical protein [Pseudovibrio ascidiaceicola]
MIKFKEKTLTVQLALLVPNLLFVTIILICAVILFGLLWSGLTSAFQTFSEIDWDLATLSDIGTAAMPVVTIGGFILIRRQIGKADEANQIALLPVVREAHSLVLDEQRHIHSLTQVSSLLQAVHIANDLSNGIGPKGDPQTNFNAQGAILAFQSLEAKVHDYLSPEVSKQRVEITLVINYIQKEVKLLEPISNETQEALRKRYDHKNDELKSIYDVKYTMMDYQQNSTASVSQNQLKFGDKLNAYSASLAMESDVLAKRLTSLQKLIKANKTLL